MLRTTRAPTRVAVDFFCFFVFYFRPANFYSPLPLLLPFSLCPYLPHSLTMPCKRHQGMRGVKCAQCIEADRKARGGESLLTTLAKNPSMASRTSHWFSREEIQQERRRLGLNPNVLIPGAPSRRAFPVEQRPIQQFPVVEQRPIEQRPIEQFPIEQRPIEQRPIMQRPIRMMKPKPEPTLRPRGSGVPPPGPCHGGQSHIWGDGICQRCGYNSNSWAHVQQPVLQQHTRKHPTRAKKANRSPKKSHTHRHVKGAAGAGRKLFRRGMSHDDDDSDSSSSDSSSD